MSLKSGRSSFIAIATIIAVLSRDVVASTSDSSLSNLRGKIQIQGENRATLHISDSNEDAVVQLSGLLDDSAGRNLQQANETFTLEVASIAKDFYDRPPRHEAIGIDRVRNVTYDLDLPMDTGIIETGSTIIVEGDIESQGPPGKQKKIRVKRIRDRQPPRNRGGRGNGRGGRNGNGNERGGGGNGRGRQQGRELRENGYYGTRTAMVMMVRFKEVGTGSIIAGGMHTETLRDQIAQQVDNALFGANPNSPSHKDAWEQCSHNQLTIDGDVSAVENHYLTSSNDIFYVDVPIRCSTDPTSTDYDPFCTLTYNSETSCSSSEFYGWPQYARNWLQENIPGFDWSAWQHKLVIFDTSAEKACNFVGMGNTGCSGSYCYSWIPHSYADKVQDYLHEIGHNLNLAHAGDLTQSGSGAEYGDMSCAMGFCCSIRCYNAPHAWELGWLDAIELDSATIDGSSSPIILNSMSTTKINATIAIDTTTWGGTDTYWIQYKTSHSYDQYMSSSWRNNVQIKRWNRGSYERSDHLIRLNTGDSWSDPTNEITINVVSTDATAATITIDRGPECATDGDCNDGNLCTTDVCTSGECVNTPITCADDGLFCNGSEVCDPIDGQCKSEGDPCTGLGGCGSLECNEITDTCDTPAPFVGETGQVALDDTIDTDGGSFFQNINFRHSYTKPVIVAFINTRGGSESIAPRIKDVTPTSFTLFMQEPDYQTHNAEGSVSYIVMEEGRHVLDGGLIVEAGLHTTSTVRSGLDLDPSFIGDDISFGQAFASTPAVLHTLNTHNNDNKFMTSMATSVSLTGFQLAQERLEISDTLETEENIGWIAFDTSAGTGETFCAPYTVGLIDPGFSVGVSDTPFVINYSSAGYSTSPDVVVSVISENEVDGSWARGSGLYSSTQQGVYAEEDQRGDAERNHASESFAWASFARNTDLIGTSITSAPTISSTPSEIPSNRPSTSPSSSPSISPSSMPTPTCDDGGNVCEVGAFDFATRECIYEPLDCRDSNSCTNDMCDASEGGCKNTLIAGCTVGETGQVTLNATISTNDHAATVTFSKSYAKPIVVAFINTRNGGQSVVPRVKDVTGTSCKIFMEEPPIGNAGSTYSGHSESEDVSYMVVETGRHELAGGLIVEAGVHDTSRVRWKGQTFAGDAISFQSSFPEPPAVLHTLQTHNNGEFMTSLATTVTQNGFEIAQEALETGTQNRVVEETLGWIALTRGTGTTNNSPYIIDMKNDNAQNGVTQAAYIIDLSEAGFTTPGDVIVSLIGENGSDGSYARGSGTYTLTQQGVYAEEDQTNDSERNHASEPFAWAAFPRNTILRLPDLPSETPSSTPSATPSLSPSSGQSAESGAPSSVPSSSPTLASDSPSSVPSASPSAESDFPSPVPSVSPSAGSDSPSLVPSPRPSAKSDSPSSAPSWSPVVVESDLPSPVPSASPSAGSDFPSPVPSVSPSAGSDSPSLVPSPRPSAKSDSPSSAPSWSPVVVESDLPSPVPSASPSAGSDSPSPVPSVSPSAGSDSPSLVPSPRPSAKSDSPSSAPSWSPVVVESDSPSPVPSSSPITTASDFPSPVPSASPSAESGAPSSVPSSSSLAPSSPPSSTPSSTPSDENSPTLIVGETGRRYLDDTIDRGHSQFVQFRHQYNDPIVVAFINSRRGGQSVSARIRSVNSSSFELFMQEPDNQNHADEHCSWMVMERGRHILEGGIVVEAGSLDTNNTHRGGYGFLSEDTNATDITFQVAFNERPAVLHSLMTHSNNDWMASLVTDVRNDGMKVALEAAESGKASPGGETIGFIAMSTGIGTNNGNPFHIGVANDYGKNGATDQGRDGVTDSPHVIEFGLTFANLAPAAPDVIVSLYGEGGTDGSWARGSGVWSATEQGVFAEEDQVKDSDRGHVDETFAWVAFSPDSEIIAAPAGSAASGAISEILTPRCGDGLCEGNEAQSCPGDCVDYSSSAPPVGAPTTEAPFECARIESSTVCKNNNECIWHRRKKTCCTPETGPGTTCSSSSECCSRVCRGNGTCL